jgi:hypothetical protein
MKPIQKEPYMSSDNTKPVLDKDVILLSEKHNLVIVLHYDQSGDEPKYLRSIELQLDSVVIVHNYQQLELFKEELLAFNKGDKNNRLLTVEKEDGAFVLKHITQETKNETLFGQTESRAIVKVINRILGNGYSFKYLFGC